MRKAWLDMKKNQTFSVCCGYAWKFLHTYSGKTDEETAFQKLADKVNTLVVTLGKRGLRWKHQGKTGKMDAFNRTSIFFIEYSFNLAKNIPF